MTVAEHSSPAGKGIDVKLPGLLKCTNFMQAVCEIVGSVKRIWMILTEYSPASSEGVIAELANLAIRANVDKETDKNVGNP
jgi:hypothetical protein